jgi:hypothetical protein
MQAGARSVSLSPIKCHEPGGDGFILRFPVGTERCTSAHRAKETPRPGWGRPADAALLLYIANRWIPIITRTTLEVG